MHAATIYDHETLQEQARDLVGTWAGTDPMQGEDEVRLALEQLDPASPAELEALLPYVVDACRSAGLLVRAT